MNKAGYVGCATCVITRGVSSIRVLFRALSGASIKTWILKGTPRSFCAGRGGAGERRENQEFTSGVKVF